MIAIVDYGLGNLYSLSHSLSHLGFDNRITREESLLSTCDKIILPGVGAFGDAIKKLSATGLVPLLRRRAQEGTPLLGICLGMQLLFEESYEFGRHEGLGLLPGGVYPLKDDLPASLKVPHIGWNSLDFVRPNALLANIREGDFVYYVHSYYAKCPEDCVLATSRYGVDVPGLVGRGRVFGAQFHPEKSGEVGLCILRSFCQLSDKE